MAIIRRAELEDSEAIVALLVRSIREICGPDYDNDEEMLSRWCANKTPENTRRGIENADNCWIVAEENGMIVGTGLMTFKGEILLCYLLPEFVGRGIGSQMLNHLLRQARILGLKKATLESTRTAREFYKHNEFIETGETLGMGMIPCFTMERNIGIDYA